MTTFAHVEPRRRCACCGVPSNRCPCRLCGACTTDAGAPGPSCACGGKRDTPLAPEVVVEVEAELALESNRAGAP